MFLLAAELRDAQELSKSHLDPTKTKANHLQTPFLSKLGIPITYLGYKAWYTKIKCS